MIPLFDIENRKLWKRQKNGDSRMESASLGQWFEIYLDGDGYGWRYGELGKDENKYRESLPPFDTERAAVVDLAKHCALKRFHQLAQSLGDDDVDGVGKQSRLAEFAELLGPEFVEVAWAYWPVSPRHLQEQGVAS